MAPAPFDPDLTRHVEAPVDPDSGEPLDCTRCGACCESGEGNILIPAEDLLRWRRIGRQDLVEATVEGHFDERAFAFHEGACLHLDRADGRSLCRIYDVRGTTCVEFQAGSWQCLEFRRDKRASGWSG